MITCREVPLPTGLPCPTYRPVPDVYGVVTTDDLATSATVTGGLRPRVREGSTVRKGPTDALGVGSGREPESRSGEESGMERIPSECTNSRVSDHPLCLFTCG